MALFPEDGRPYVSLGKLMVQQRRYDEALALYEEGCTATGERAQVYRQCAGGEGASEQPAGGRGSKSTAGLPDRQLPHALACPPAPAAGGTNAHIWAAWAYLAAKLGNVSLARRLYDAAIVASPTHAAAWHGWGLLEKDQGNFLR